MRRDCWICGEIVAITFLGTYYFRNFLERPAPLSQIAAAQVRIFFMLKQLLGRNSLSDHLRSIIHKSVKKIVCNSQEDREKQRRSHTSTS